MLKDLYIKNLRKAILVMTHSSEELFKKKRRLGQNQNYQSKYKKINNTFTFGINTTELNPSKK